MLGFLVLTWFLSAALAGAMSAPRGAALTGFCSGLVLGPFAIFVVPFLGDEKTAEASAPGASTHLQPGAKPLSYGAWFAREKAKDPAIGYLPRKSLASKYRAYCELQPETPGTEVSVDDSQEPFDFATWIGEEMARAPTNRYLTSRQHRARYEAYRKNWTPTPSALNHRTQSTDGDDQRFGEMPPPGAPQEPPRVTDHEAAAQLLAEMQAQPDGLPYVATPAKGIPWELTLEGRLTVARRLYEQDLITPEEYEDLRNRLLEEL